MRIAVVGGGLTGCLIALEYAERGHQVMLFDREASLLSRASAANEGKIHLGYCYAADDGFRTAERLIEDALWFRPILERWMTPETFDTCVCEPFYYTVPTDSALSEERITAHFARVDIHIRERKRHLGLAYLGQDETPDFTPCQPDHAADAPFFLTQERGVWPIGIAERIDGSVRAHPRIELRLASRVHRIEPSGSKWRVGLTEPTGATEGPFDIVVNAAWAERRSIDRRSGHSLPGSWFTRYKFGVIVQQASLLLAGDVPRNTTATSGPFGDCVHYPANDSLYCSWYPVGMCFSTMDDELGQRPILPQPPETLMRGTFEGCATFAPVFRRLAALPSPLPARIVGDFIIAKGRSDIDDPGSELHRRSDHGVRELAPGYWSIETGKYTSAPRCAIECVDASLGRA
ncbi:FAD-dependent oxidoreductase [Aquibium carbonis]|nr:FAD-dependent oxidoreductase [Aquibium carbonis]